MILIGSDVGHQGPMAPNFPCIFKSNMEYFSNRRHLFQDFVSIDFFNQGLKHSFWSIHFRRGGNHDASPHLQALGTFRTELLFVIGRFMYTWNVITLPMLRNLQLSSNSVKRDFCHTGRSCEGIAPLCSISLVFQNISQLHWWRCNTALRKPHIMKTTERFAEKVDVIVCFGGKKWLYPW